MAAVRRSTRLSSISKSTPRKESPLTICRRRQPNNFSSSDDDDEDKNNSNKFLIRQDLENNENSNMLMNTNIAKTIKSRGSSNIRTVNNICEIEPKTPRSSKMIIKPMPASKKRELMEKRKMVEQYSDDTTDDEDNTTRENHVSPPKQSKLQQKTLPQHLISPTRLLNRLSIDERQDQTDEDDAGYEDNDKNVNKDKVAELKTQTSSPVRNKYQNARRVLNSAETQNLPGREQQLQELREFFSTHLAEQRSGSLYVSGQPGTGKTACLSLLIRSPEFAQKLQNVYINCTSIASVGAVYKKLCNELDLKNAGRTERDHLEAIQKYIRTAKRMLLIVLDEIDQLCSARQAVLYTIFEWPAIPGARILLVGIANSLDLTDRALMRLNARCELKPQLMHFPPYTKQQLVEIFKSRLAEADVLDVFPPVTLQLLAAKVSAVSGDVRRALDIGRRVVEIAEQQKRAGERQFNIHALDVDAAMENASAAETLQPVQITQVAAVLNKVYGAAQNLQNDIEESFPLQQKLMLCSLLLMLRNERNKDISIGRLHEVYRRVCNKRNIHALDQAEFAGTVDLVETRGILRIIRKKEPRLHKVLLQWDEGEVNAALCDKQLIASILNDTSCLTK